MNDIDIDAIRHREQAATDGPWTTGADKTWSDVFPPWALVINAAHPLIELESGPQGTADAEFIAHARQDIPDLLATVDELTTKLADRNASLDRVIGERDALDAELTKTEAYYRSAKGEVADVRRQMKATEAALTQSRAQAATHANTVGTLTAENARVRQQRDAHAESGPDYLIWSQHHQSWWGPNRSGYRSNPDDAGRYTLAAAQAEMGRGCYCCRVPEVPVPAEKVIGRGDAAIQSGITDATAAAIAEGRENKAYDPAEATR
ncbi:hypothetical protein ACWD69_09525 [Micromonospora chokoriensis]